MQLIALSLTLALEMGGAAAIWWMQRMPARPLRRALLVVAATNLVTHPLFWLALRRLPWGGAAAVGVAETVVVVAEAAVYWRLLALPLHQAVVYSLVLNALSWSGGVVFWQFWLAA
jgi:hypothetical protein